MCMFTDIIHTDSVFSFVFCLLNVEVHFSSINKKGRCLGFGMVLHVIYLRPRFARLTQSTDALYFFLPK